MGLTCSLKTRLVNGDCESCMKLSTIRQHFYFEWWVMARTFGSAQTHSFQ